MDTGTPWPIGLVFNISVCQAWISLLHLPDPRAKRITVFKVKCFKEAYLIGSNGVLAGARLVRSSRRVCHSCLWVCLRGNYPGDERDFRPCWCWRVNFPVYQQWVTYNHQWCWVVCQACISLLHLPEPRAKRKTALKVKSFKEAFNVVQNEPCQLVQKPGRSSRRGFPYSLWVCLSGSYPGDEWDFHPYWYGWANFPDYQQWLTCTHQWYWTATSCPETGT